MVCLLVFDFSSTRAIVRNMANKHGRNIHKPGAATRVSKTYRQALLARVVEYANGANVAIPPALVKDLLAVDAPWMTRPSRDTSRGTVSADTSAALHRHWSEYFGNALRLIKGDLGDLGLIIRTPVLSLAFNVIPLPSPPGWRRHIVSIVDGSPEDVLLFQLAALVQAVGFASLLECDCGKPFVKVGRRKFCSTRCQKRVFMRGQRAEERASDQRHIEAIRRRRSVDGKATR